MKTLIILVILFSSFFSQLYSQDAAMNTSDLASDEAQVLYNGPSEQLLFLGFGNGFITNFLYCSDSHYSKMELIAFVNTVVEYRVQIGDLFAFDATLDYHTNLIFDGDGSIDLVFENRLGMTPIFLAHFIHESKTKMYKGATSINIPFASLSSSKKPELQEYYDVEILDTVSLRLGTSLFLGANGISIRPAQSLIVGVEYRSLAQAAYKTPSGRNLIFQDFYCFTIDGIINYPADDTYLLTDCLGLNFNSACTLFGLVWNFNLGFSSFTLKNSDIIDHNFHYGTTILVPIRL